MADPLAGAHTLAITPFDDAGEIDERSLASLIYDLIAGGVHGFLGLGTTGEFFTLTAPERAHLMRAMTRMATGGATGKSISC